MAPSHKELYWNENSLYFQIKLFQSKLEYGLRHSDYVQRSVYQWHIFTTLNRPETIIWKNLWQSLIIKTTIDYSIKMLAKCKSSLSATNTPIPSFLITWTVIENFLEEFCKVVRTRMSLQFSMPEEISTSQDKLLRTMTPPLQKQVNSDWSTGLPVIFQ